MSPFDEARARVVAPDAAAEEAAWTRHHRLTKPPGALGDLESLGVLLCGIAGECPPPVPEPAAVAVFAADHGVVAEGVTAWPQDVTAQMVANFVNGGAAVNVLARHTGSDILVVDVGVASDIEAAPGLLDRKIARGTRNLRVEDAMTLGETRQALDVGAEVAATLVERGARCLVTGEMGIGNTTSASALVAKLCQANAVAVAGRGAGGDDRVVARKIEVVADALRRTWTTSDPVEILAALGGYEIAALTGFVVGGAAARVPVLVDGLIAQAALLMARDLCFDAWQYAIAGHRSAEPASQLALMHLGLEPLLDAGLRLGEGTGALLALPLVQAAARILGEMATFDEAGVSEKSLG